NTAGGSAETDLRLQFPLLKDLALSQLDYQANATLNGMRLPNWVLGLNLSRGNLQLDVDKEGLDVTGSARLGSMPLRLQWRRNFGDKIPYRERFLVRGTVQQSQLVREIGLNFPPFAGGYLRGSVAANLVVTRQDSGRTAIIGDLDLTESQLHNPVFAWNKAPGENAHGKFELILQGGKVRSLNRFSLAGAGLKVEGTASFNRQGTNITRLNLTELSQGRNNATVTLTPDEGSGWLLEVNGDSFDLSPLRDDLLAAGGGGGGGVTDPISATINLQHVWMTPTRGVENVMGTFRYDGQKWIFGNIEGNLKEGGAILLGLTSKERERQVRVRSSNAGAALRALDVYDSISGGSLALDAVLADAEPDSPLRGKLVLTSFRLLDAPVMARLLSLAALTGILESLGGEGLAFNRLELPFSKAGSTLRISEGQAYGLSLGITASGRINVASNAVSLTGTIVPAYAINSALGRIPLLGTIVTGGETGSGLFAATYSVGGTLSAPEASIQPLSALAPGFLRNLFNLEEEEEALPAQAPAEPESLRPFDR
ncbi:MAG: AsmA-like C-terminal region-containing protein, partial [Magnetospiraceae bacterium]